MSVEVLHVWTVIAADELQEVLEDIRQNVDADLATVYVNGLTLSLERDKLTDGSVVYNLRGSAAG